MWVTAAVFLAVGCAAEAPDEVSPAAAGTTGAVTTSGGGTLTSTTAPATSTSETGTAPTTAPAGGTAPTGSTVPAWWREPSADAPLRVWVIGDSLAGPVGSALADQGRTAGWLRATVAHLGGTGLARPDVFDWPGYLAELPPATPLDAVIVILGANDTQGLASADGWLPFGTPAWDDRYGTLVGSFLSQLLSVANRVYWVGVPIMASPGYDANVRHLNGILQGQTAARPETAYIDAYTLFQDEAGQYAASLPDPEGTLVTVRASDGIHYTTEGARRMARRIMEVLAADWGSPGL